MAYLQHCLGTDAADCRNHRQPEGHEGPERGRAAFRGVVEAVEQSQHEQADARPAGLFEKRQQRHARVDR